MDRYEALEKLASLKERGILTEDEFASEKSKLLESDLSNSLSLGGANGFHFDKGIKRFLSIHSIISFGFFAGCLLTAFRVSFCRVYNVGCFPLSFLDTYFIRCFVFFSSILMLSLIVGRKNPARISVTLAVSTIVYLIGRIAFGETEYLLNQWMGPGRILIVITSIVALTNLAKEARCSRESLVKSYPPLSYCVWILFLLIFLITLAGIFG